MLGSETNLFEYLPAEKQRLAVSTKTIVERQVLDDIGLIGDFLPPSTNE